MTPRTRKLVLTAHITTSVGWLGAVMTSLVLAVIGLLSSDTEAVRGAYLTLDMLGWFVLLPFSIASLLTGLLQSLGGPWGLLRHYWVMLKLLMNLFATTVLLLYTRTLGTLATGAREMSQPGDLQTEQRLSPVVHSTGALLLLVVAVTLSVYKPRGLTRYGRRPPLRMTPLV